MRPAISAQRLMIKLIVYFVLLFGGVLAVGLLNPDILTLMPFGGTDALEIAFTLGGTILVMLLITWTYIATRREIGFRKNFVRALIVLPICAATIVLLIQNNHALAFGPPAGIGYLGIAVVMAVFFCFANAILWHLEFGQNPIDDTRIARKQSKLG